MLTAILTQADPEGHLCVVLVPESIVIPSDDSPELMSNFQAKCVGCGRHLESYAEFCEHFRINPNFPKEHVFQYFGQMDSDSMLIRADLLVRIPWSQSRSGQPTIAESPSRSNMGARPTQQGNSDGEQRIPVDQLAPMGSPSEINPIQHVIEVPEGILGKVFSSKLNPALIIYSEINEEYRSAAPCLLATRTKTLSKLHAHAAT